MKKKILTVLGISLFSIILVVVGFYLAFISFTYLEMNDRLKYEVAYLNGYQKIQQKLNAGEIEEAKEILGFIIDAHLITLTDFSYLESSENTEDINKILCNVLKMRNENPAIRRKESPEEAKIWQNKIDNFVSSRGVGC